MEHEYQPITARTGSARTGFNQEDNVNMMQDMVMEEILSNGRNGISDFGNYRNTLSLNNDETAGLTSGSSAGSQLPTAEEYRMNVGNFNRTTNNNYAQTRANDSVRASGYSSDRKNPIIGVSSSIAGLNSPAARRQNRIRVFFQIIAVIGICLMFLFLGMMIGKNKEEATTSTVVAPTDTTPTTPTGTTPIDNETTTTTIPDDQGTTGGVDTTTDSGTSTEPDTTTGTDGGVDAGFDRYDKLVSLLKESKYSTNPNDFSSSTTPQSQAANWLANEDPLQIPIDAASVSLRQRYALAVLYYSSGGSNWQASFKFLSAVSECHWNDWWDPRSKEYTDNRPYVNEDEQYNIGVLCNYAEDDTKNTIIQRLYLPSIHMTGAIPTELALLTDLVELNLYNNEFDGQIPSALSKLVNLKALALHQNNLNGEFPSWIGDDVTGLQVINLGDNNIDGKIPTNIQNLVSLTSFNCESCLLTGSIEPLHGLTLLNKIHLGANMLTGPLTDAFIASLTNLEELDLGKNRLTGNLPATLFDSTQIDIIDLHGNQFSGSIPAVNVDTSINVLALHENLLTGTIDNIIAALSPKIQHLDLSSNQFTGNGVPTTIGLLTDLKYLFIAMNPDLSQSPIPTEIGLLTELIDVSFQNSNRMGKIPYQIEGLQLLTTFDLNNNYLTGPIPSELGSLPQLRFLFLRGNQLTGQIPSTMSKLTHLDTVLLDSNKAINAGTEHLCAASPKPRILQADCAVFDMDCECCTVCCDRDDGADCTNKQYYSNIDPSAEYHYVRKFYQFNDADVVFPVASVPKSELPMYFEDEDGNQFAVDAPVYGMPFYSGMYEYAPYDYETNNAEVANPFEEYIEDADYMAGDKESDVITDEQVYNEGGFEKEIDSFEDVYKDPFADANP